MNMSVNVNSEYDKLSTVLIGLLNNNNTNDMQPVNNVFKNNFDKGKFPIKENIEEEFENYVEKLEENKIEVIRPELIKDNSLINNQLYTRDLGFIIGDTFFVSPLTLEIRKGEIQGIISLLDKYKNNIVYIPNNKNINIEGGDVFVDNYNVYVGIGPRTNLNGYIFLKKNLDKKYNVQFIEHNCVHLDCCFNIIDKNVLLLCKPYILDKDNEKMENIYKQYESIVEVSIYESDLMMTNILSIGNKTIVVNNSNDNVRLNNIFKLLDFNLIEVNFDNANLLGGSFRCASLPLIRN